MLNAIARARLAAREIRYGSAPRQVLDVYAPADGPRAAPVIVFFHGGSWDSGRKALYRFLGSAYAAAGCVVVIPEYRLFPEIRYPVFLDDCAAAVAWTLGRAAAHGGDVSRGVVLMGHSAGAYNAAMLALEPTFLARAGVSRDRGIARAIGLAGPYDFLPLRDAKLAAIFGPPDRLPETQPINHVDGRAPPMFLATGDADTVVRPGNTVRLAARIRAAGGTVEERIYRGVGHRQIVGAIAAPLRFLAPVLRDTLAFIAG